MPATSSMTTLEGSGVPCCETWNISLADSALLVSLFPSERATADADGTPTANAAIAAAKEILAMKNARAMYANAVPGMVEKTKITLIQQNLNYQKDLNEVAPIW